MRFSIRSVLAVLSSVGVLAIWVAPGSAATVSVPAAGTGSNYFRDSRLFIPPGDSVVVTASGKWRICPDRFCRSGPDGVSALPGPGVGAGDFADPAANNGTLIGSTDGATTWFALGRGPTVVTGPGELLLAANDTPPQNGNCGFIAPTGCYSDNSGSITAVITFVATSKGQCKQGGWRSLVDASKTPFKNQGDCVSYVATGGKNPAG
jgi:hypothetical protein